MRSARSTRIKTIAAAATAALTITTLASTAAAVPQEQPHAAVTSATGDEDIRAAVESELAGLPAYDSLNQQEKDTFLDGVVDLGQSLGEDEELTPGLVAPAFDIGLGWGIYINNITPSEQRVWAQASVGTVAAILCAASGGLSCGVAGGVAAILVPTISEYLHPTYCLSVRLVPGGPASSWIVNEARRHACP